MTNEAYPSTLCNRQHFKSNKSNGKVDIIQTKNKSSNFFEDKKNSRGWVAQRGWGGQAVGLVNWSGWSGWSPRVVDQSGHYGLI